MKKAILSLLLIFTFSAFTNAQTMEPAVTGAGDNKKVDDFYTKRKETTVKLRAIGASDEMIEKVNNELDKEIELHAKMNEGSLTDEEKAIIKMQFQMETEKAYKSILGDDLYLHFIKQTTTEVNAQPQMKAQPSKKTGPAKKKKN